MTAPRRRGRAWVLAVAAVAATAGLCGCAGSTAPPPTTPAGPDASGAPAAPDAPVAPFATVVAGETRLAVPDDERLVAALGGQDATVTLAAGDFTLYGLCDGPEPVTLTFEAESEPFWVVPCDGLPSRLRGSIPAGTTAHVAGQEQADWQVLVTTPAG